MAAERSRKGVRRGGRAAERRGRARVTTGRGGGARKERVLHTRISEKLAQDIYRVAEDLRVPTSNLVRNVLEDAFRVVETVTDNVGDLIENILDEAERTRDRIARSVERTRRAVQKPVAAEQDEEPDGDEDDGKERPDFSDILGWQPMLLNHAQPCSDCGGRISRGERAVVGMAATGMTATYLCLACLNARR